LRNVIEDGLDCRGVKRNLRNAESRRITTSGGVEQAPERQPVTDKQHRDLFHQPSDGVRYSTRGLTGR
jgi:hypothetical protein